MAWLWALAAVSLASAAGCSRGGDWQRKDAYRLCAPAIDDYPAKPAPPCSAMLMCANEAVLTAAQYAKLTEMLKAAGCAAP